MIADFSDTGALDSRTVALRVIGWERRLNGRARPAHNSGSNSTRGIELWKLGTSELNIWVA